MDVEVVDLDVEEVDVEADVVLTLPTAERLTRMQLR
jgi:hypothetical protein